MIKHIPVILLAFVFGGCATVPRGTMSFAAKPYFDIASVHNVCFAADYSNVTKTARVAGQVDAFIDAVIQAAKERGYTWALAGADKADITIQISPVRIIGPDPDEELAQKSRALEAVIAAPPLWKSMTAEANAPEAQVHLMSVNAAVFEPKTNKNIGSAEISSGECPDYRQVYEILAENLLDYCKGAR